MFSVNFQNSPAVSMTSRLSPRLAPVRSIVRRKAAQTRQMRAVKTGLNQAAVPQVNIPLAGNQPISQKPPRGTLPDTDRDCDCA